MTNRAKYLYSFTCGSIFWAIVFYLVGYRGLRWDSKRLAVVYSVLEALIAAVVLALYRSERITFYRERIRYRVWVLVCVVWGAGVAVAAWGLSSAGARWSTILVCILAGLVGAVASGLGIYKSIVKLGLGASPNDVDR